MLADGSYHFPLLHHCPCHSAPPSYSPSAILLFLLSHRLCGRRDITGRSSYQHTKMAAREAGSSFSIRNCTVVVEGNEFSSESGPDSLLISTSTVARIKISVSEVDTHKKFTTESHKYMLSHHLSKENGGMMTCLGCFDILLLNPKDKENFKQLSVEPILELYKQELPMMKYAANTGKKSSFLEKCISSGKYCTLFLKSTAVKECGEVIAAMSYQIIPVDMRYAEIPLAVVKQSYQLKGIGHLLYAELRRRLKNVGVSVILCWGDKKSEGFWLKQGFVSVADVDSTTRARRLPIRASVQKALCFPGGSILMVSDLEKDAVPVYPWQQAPNWGLTDEEATYDMQNGGNGFSINQCSCSLQHKKRRVWEASISSLKSKKIKGGHETGCNIDSAWNLVGQNDSICDAELEKRSSHASLNKFSAEIIPEDAGRLKICEVYAKEYEPPQSGIVNEVANETYIYDGQKPVIMLMNIVDEAKKTRLSEIIEDLGGSITTFGVSCTHVITGKVRRTLNFCTALCSGAWIVSPDWLRASFKSRRYVGELSYVLKDDEYEQKYKSELKDAVLRVRKRRHGLLKGYDVFFANHVQPSVDTLCTIVISASGKALCGLEEVEEPSRTILVACEEDMEMALEAAKRGIRTYNSEWFMSCVMRQELDFEAPQFAEPL